MIQRIIYINKAGQTIDMVFDIIGKKSKNIIVKRPDDDAIMIIPRKDIESITDPKEKNE